MKTKLLSATGPELSKMLGEVLHGKHKEDESGFCENCYLFMTKENLEKDPTCDIELFPGNAFKWRDWAVKKYGGKHYHYQLEQIYRSGLDSASDYSQYGFSLWIIKAQPEHFLKAAALCVLNDKESD